MPNGNNGRISGTTVVICLTSILCITIAAIVAVFLSSADTTDALARAGIITAFVGVFIPQMFLLIRQEQTTQAVEAVKEDTHAFRNGEGQAKIETAVHKALEERGLGETPK